MIRRLLITTIAAALSAAAFAGNPVVKFGIVTDVQYDSKENSEWRHYSEGVARLSEAVDTFNATEGLSFVADLGDMTDRDPFCYAALKAVTDRLVAPLHNVLGNHDLAPLKTADEMERALKLKGLDKLYYSFVKGGVRFIVLNTVDCSPALHPEGSERRMLSEQWQQDMETIGAKNRHAWNGGIGFEQLNWLDAELRKADRRGQCAVIMCHIPLYPFDIDEALWNSIEVTHLIESHPSVKAVLCGHRHHGGYAIRNGIHYINFKGMVEGDTNRYAVVTIDTAAGRLIIDGYGDEPDRVLEL